VRLKLLEPPLMEFTAGQYIYVRVPPYELSAQPVYRTYSIASDPAHGEEIDLQVRYVPRGISTTYIHRYLKVGDELTVSGPAGDFRLRDSSRDILFVAGGSGMAPIRAMLLDMVAKRNPRRKRFFFGARSRRDLFLVEEMAELEKKLRDFRFIPALSEPLPGDDWDGETGLIPEVACRHLESAGNTEAYLCGSPSMVNACVEALRRKGLPDQLIFFDKFG